MNEQVIQLLYPFIGQRICEKIVNSLAKAPNFHTYSCSSTHQNKMKTHLNFLLVAMVTGHFGGKKPKIGDFCNVEF